MSCLRRNFHFVHRDLGVPMGSWMAVEPNSTRLPSTRASPTELRATLPPLRGFLHYYSITKQFNLTYLRFCLRQHTTLFDLIQHPATVPPALLKLRTSLVALRPASLSLSSNTVILRLIVLFCFALSGERRVGAKWRIQS